MLTPRTTGVSAPDTPFWPETEDFFLDMNIIETEDDIIIDGFVEHKILLVKLMIMKLAFYELSEEILKFPSFFGDLSESWQHNIDERGAATAFTKFVP